MEGADALPLPSSTEIDPSVPVPSPPFLGSRVVERIEIDALLPFINEEVLFKFQWQYKQKARSKEEYERIIDRDFQFRTLRIDAE